MLNMESLDKTTQRIVQPAGSVPIMVQLHFDIAESLSGYTRRQRLDVFGLIFFNRVEKRVLQRTAEAVGESFGELRILIGPACYAVVLNLSRAAAVFRFPVIDDANKNMLHTGTWCGLPPK